MYNRPSNFKDEIKSIKNGSELATKLNSLSKENADIFISNLIADHENFLRIFKNYSHVTNILSDIKNDEIRNKLFDAVLSETYFEKIFRKANDVSNCVHNLKEKPSSPWPLDAKIVDQYINKLQKKVFEEKSLKHFLTNKQMTEQLLRAFPNLTERLASNEEVIKSARMIAQGTRSSTSLFSFLPSEILINIAKHTRTHSDHSEEEAEKLANNNLNKPVARKK